ncbi:plastidic glucose transporter 4 isoform X1 [Spatholobus suberectus]|nr:plastidic glucose transporter 4 isoform X1 [Spatholobus suberectus]
MQVSTFGVQGATFGVQNRSGLVGFGEFRNVSVLRPRRVSMRNNNTDLCGLRLGSVTMETELTSTRVGFGGIFGPSVKPRSVTVMASGLYDVAGGFDLFGLFWHCEIFWTAFASDVCVTCLAHVDGACVVLFCLMLPCLDFLAKLVL